ncbi:SNF1-interacting protein [Sorochytrium milnesiophthora]
MGNTSSSSSSSAASGRNSSSGNNNSGGASLRSRSSRSSTAQSTRRLRSPFGLGGLHSAGSTASSASAVARAANLLNAATNESPTHDSTYRAADNTSTGAPPRPSSGGRRSRAPDVQTPPKLEDTVVDAGHTVPRNKLYHAQYHYDRSIVASLIQSRKLAPFYDGLADVDELELEQIDEDMQQQESIADSSTAPSAHGSSASVTDEAAAASTGPSPKEVQALKKWVVTVGGAVECPICFLFYPKNINYSRCCDQPICTECFVQIKRPESNEEAPCPYCVVPGFGVLYLPPDAAKSPSPSHKASNASLSQAAALMHGDVVSSPVPADSPQHEGHATTAAEPIPFPQLKHTLSSSAAEAPAISELSRSMDLLSMSAPDSHRNGPRSAVTVTATTYTRNSRTFSVNSSLSAMANGSAALPTHSGAPLAEEDAPLPRSRSNTIHSMQSNSIAAAANTQQPAAGSDRPGDQPLAELGGSAEALDPEQARKQSMKTSRASLVTSDDIRPGYVRQLRQQHQMQALREHQEAALSRVRRMLFDAAHTGGAGSSSSNNNNSGGGGAQALMARLGAVTSSESRRQARSERAAVQQAIDPFSPGSLLATVSQGNASGNGSSGGSRRQRNSVSRNANADRGYMSAMRTIGADLEELMMMEAIRQSMVDEEERQRKAQAEEAKAAATAAAGQAGAAAASTVTDEHAATSSDRQQSEDDDEPLMVAAMAARRRSLDLARAMDHADSSVQQSTSSSSNGDAGHTSSASIKRSSISSRSGSVSNVGPSSSSDQATAHVAEPRG